MKKLILTLSIVAVCLIGRVNAAEINRFEYATIRWAGRENTHIIRPSGKVEFVGAEMQKMKKPDRVDDRAFYTNVVINALAKEGYEVVAMTNDEILLKRPVTPRP